MSYNERNNDPKWKAARFATMSRDRYTCQRCGKNNTKLNVHHICTWSRYPELRYTLSNLITLCLVCHELCTGKEEAYEEEFKRILAQKRILKGKRAKGTIYKKPKWRAKNPRNHY